MAQLEHITPEQVAQYGVVAAPDRLTGKAQDNKAIFDRLVRELVATVVNNIIDKTNELLTAEDVREENESERIASENLRVEAENIRVQAENIRVENEQARIEAEAARVSAELLRVQAENLRTSAENARKTAETAREEAEARRESTTNGIVVRATEQAEAAERSAVHASNSEQEAAGYSRSAGESAASASQSASNAAQSAQGAGTSAGNAQASATAAAEAVKHYPRINLSTMTWFLWDPEKGEFVDTGVIAEGRNGIEADGLWGVYVDEEGFLVVTYSGDDPPPLSISDDGYLVYTLNGQEIRVGKTVGPEGPEGPEGPRGLGVPEATPEDADKIPIVAPDGTYKLGYQSGAIDDTKAQTDKTWSSLTTVDRLAPVFESSGPVVTCNPVEGYPLHVVSQIVAVQSGSGDPSPENVRPISGWAQATLTHNDTPITLPFGQTVYGGELDWTTGVLTVDWIKHIFNDADSFTGSAWRETESSIGTLFTIQPNRAEYPIASELPNVLSPVLQSLSYRDIYSGNIDGPAIGFVTGGVTDQRMAIRMPKTIVSSAEEIKNWLIDNAVEVVYQIADPTNIQLTPTEILALSGTNTLYTDTGDTTVSGRADPNAIINNLAQRIAALESAVVSN